MNSKHLLLSAMLLLGTVLGVTIAEAQGPTPRAPRANVGTAFTYQGYLKDNGTAANGTYDFEFGLCDAASDGTCSFIHVDDVTVTNGYFTVLLNFGAVFKGEARFLEIRVRPGASSGPYTTLLPRQPLTPAPYALALPGLWTQQNDTSPNLIGGYKNNQVTNGVIGATIGGGGAYAGSNYVTDDYGVVGGGLNNRAGDNDANTSNANYATVSGGQGNRASGYFATVGGGMVNTASGIAASVSGGETNTASGSHAAIGGGLENSAIGNYAIVPGGRDNVAQGDYSFAAGRRAQANHEGAFVWGDSTNADVASTTTNQFVIRATNGLVLTQNAGQSKTVGVGEYYRDNAIVAWARITAGGTIDGGFGVASITKSTGVYTVTLTATTQDDGTLIPVAIAEVDGAPTSAASARLVTVNQFATNRFIVYITNGNYALVDNDFVLIVTGR